MPPEPVPVAKTFSRKRRPCDEPDHGSQSKPAHDRKRQTEVLLVEVHAASFGMWCATIPVYASYSAS